MTLGYFCYKYNINIVEYVVNLLNISVKCSQFAAPNHIYTYVYVCIWIWKILCGLVSNIIINDLNINPCLMMTFNREMPSKTNFKTVHTAVVAENSIKLYYIWRMRTLTIMRKQFSCYLEMQQPRNYFSRRNINAVPFHLLTKKQWV